MTALDWSQADHAPTLAEAMRDEADLTAELCPTDEPCEMATSCPFCGETICVDHGSDDLTCVGDIPKVLHHWGCRTDCVECQEFFRAERLAKAGDDWS